MQGKNYYVFRINYDEGWAFEPLRNDIIDGKLRQGWGTEGLDLTKGFDSFKANWPSDWENDDESIRKRYNILVNMLNMKEGDLIVIPKVSVVEEGVGSHFTIAEVTGKYSFEPLTKFNDFGHVIPIRVIGSYSNQLNSDTRTISNKFRRPYAKAVNNVYIPEFIDAVDHVIEDTKDGTLAETATDVPPLVALSHQIKEHQTSYLNNILNVITSWSPGQMENIVKALFEHAGYTTIARNRWDGKGGDIDLVFNSFSDYSLMWNVFDADDVADMPEIRVQVKCKRGVDSGDVTGVKQLIESAGSESSVNILISSATGFSDEAKKLARGKVTLVDGIHLAHMIERFGLDSLDVDDAEL